MATPPRPANLRTFRDLAPTAERHGFAIGSFSPRYPKMIAPVLRAAEALASPLLVQISHKDMNRCRVEVEAFAEAFFREVEALGITVPVALHLDHTEELELIERAVAAGFSSVMIDASELPFAENAALTRRVVDFGHAHGVSVEGELGTIGAFAFAESEAREDADLTDPAEVEAFVAATGVDALAVSVGTVHGVDAGREVAIDVARLRAIRERSSVHLVLHGGSGIDAATMAGAIDIPGGGVSKINLATDLELAMLAELASRERLVDAQIEALSAADLGRARAAVEAVVRDKISRVLRSEGRVRHYPAERP